MTLDEVDLELIEGVEGMSVALNGFRIAGPKPWGGGTIIKEWKVKVEGLATALEGIMMLPLRGEVELQREIQG